MSGFPTNFPNNPPCIFCPWGGSLAQRQTHPRDKNSNPQTRSDRREAKRRKDRDRLGAGRWRLRGHGAVLASESRPEIAERLRRQPGRMGIGGLKQQGRQTSVRTDGGRHYLVRVGRFNGNRTGRSVRPVQLVLKQRCDDARPSYVWDWEKATGGCRSLDWI